MASVLDVAKWFVELEPMEPAKLHALCYFAQGHMLAFTGLPLFPETLYADPEGPRTEELKAMIDHLEVVYPEDL